MTNNWKRRNRIYDHKYVFIAYYAKILELIRYFSWRKWDYQIKAYRIDILEWFGEREVGGEGREQ